MGLSIEESKKLSPTAKALLDYKLRMTSIEDHLGMIDVNDPKDVQETISFCINHCTKHFAPELKNIISCEE